MQVRQLGLKGADGVTPDALAALRAIDPQLVLAFGGTRAFRDPSLPARLAGAFPAAQRVGCSTAGEISAEGSDDDTLLLSALRFDHPGVHVAQTRLADMDDSRAAGARVGDALREKGAHTVLCFAPGTNINGSALIEGMMSALPGVRIAGGLAGDGADFQQTFTLHDGEVGADQVVAVGFSNDHLRAGFGSYGGWKPFGPARQVTRARHNVLYELDGEPALDVYKRYLGDHAQRLPSSGLLFPFSMLTGDRREVGLIRTILSVCEADGSLTLAGDVIEQGYLQLMHASTDALVEGATSAAEAATLPGDTPGFALLVSCVGRKLVMGGRTDEEVDAVVDVLGAQHAYAGFHSYGEISPGAADVRCDLYNQTMTVTFLREA